MKIKAKKFVALLSAAMLFFNIVTGSVASAEEATHNSLNSVQTGTDISVQGTDVFGNMLAAELQSAQDQQVENDGQNILSIEMSGKTATVEYSVLTDCTAVVGIYDESGTTMLASGNADISADEKTVEVTVAIDTMPQYYYIKAFLIDKTTMRPLCSVYENPMYTKEMQEFLAKTTDDFAEDKVYNLDDDKTNNFAVFNDEVTVITDEPVSMSDSTVVFGNITNELKTLSAGDVFAFYYEDQLYIYNVSSVKADSKNNRIEISFVDDDSIELEDIFDYVKIDGTSSAENCTATPTGDADEGVTYLGMNIESSEESSAAEYSSLEDGISREDLMNKVEVSGTVTASHEFKIEKEFKSESNNGIGEGTTSVTGKLSASLKFSAAASAKVYITLSEQYVELKLDYSATLNASFTGSAKLEVPLGQELGFAICPGVYVGITPKIIAEISASITLEGTLSGTIGFKCDGKSITNLTTTPKFETKLTIEGKYYLGFSLSPRIILLTEYLASAGAEAQVGAEINAKSDIFQWDSSKLVKHDCTVCINGDITAKAKVGFDITFFKNDDFKLSITPFEFSWKLFDFYYSNINGFDLGSCPNKSYKTRVTVYDNTLQAVNDAVIFVDGNSVSTDSYEATVYLKTGNHDFKAENPNYRTSSKKEEIKSVSDKPNEVMLIMYPKDYSGSGGISNSGGDSGDSGDSGETDGPNIDIGIKENRLSLGNGYSAYITENGDLYTWGKNDYGQLGNGTRGNNKITPQKIMGNVSKVYTGIRQSACITTNRDLYIWGNYSSKDGNALLYEAPVKIMSNVLEASLGDCYGACIISEGDLYTWGCNDNGELGNGNNVNSYEPIKIMSNVSHVSLGAFHSACITESGDLYTWGSNYYGELGDGTTTDSNIPKKIMGDVLQVCLGERHTACINENGDLYTWGRNDYGQLGDSTTTDSSTPIKIMSNVSQVSLSGYHSACIAQNGEFYTWGGNGYGQLGDGGTTNSYTPNKIMSNISHVSLGDFHSACITSKGALLIWGRNTYGQLGNGTSTNSSVPIKITIPTESTSAQNAEITAAVNAQNASADGTYSFTDLLPNEIYNIYSMNSRTAEEPFGSDNLLYIEQKTSDNSGELSVKINSEKSGVAPEVFVKAMNGGDIDNAVINSIKQDKTSATVSWDAVDGAGKYTVHTVRNGVYIKETDTKALSYTIGNLAGGTEYGFIVQAWVNGEYSVLDKSDAVFFMTESASHKHSPEASWTFDSTGHWHNCTGCSEKLDFAEHTDDMGKITKQPTETEEGEKEYRCTICKYLLITEVLPPKPASPITVNDGTETKTFDDLNTALKAYKTTTNALTITLNKDANVKTVSLPTKAESITFTGTGALNVSGTSITIPTNTTFNTEVNGKGKTLAVRVSKDKTLSINKATSNIGAVSGTRTSILNVNEDAEALSIATFGTVNVEDGKTLTVTSRLSAVTSLNGAVKLPTSKTTAATVTAGNAEIILTDGNIAKVTLAGVTNKLNVKVVNENGETTDLSSGTIVLYSTKDISEKVTVENTTADQKELNAFYYKKNKAVKAEWADAVTLYNGETSRNFPNVELVLANITDKNTDYTITLNTDVTEPRFILPKTAKSITINGTGSLTTAVTNIAVPVDTTIGCEIKQSANKAIALRSAANTTLTLSAENSFGAVSGTRTSTLVISEDAEALSIATFGTVNVEDGKTLTVTSKLSAVTSLNGAVKLPTAKTTAMTVTAGNAELVLTDGNIAKVTLADVTEKLNVKVVDENNETVKLASGTIVLYGTKDISQKTTIENTTSEDKVLTAFYYKKNKAVKAEWADAVTLSYSDTSRNFPNIELAFEDINDKTKSTDYTITLNTDLNASTFVLPAMAKSVKITSADAVRTINLTNITAVSAKTPLKLENIKLESTKPYTISTAYDLTLDRFNSDTITAVKGGAKATLTLGETTPIDKVSGFGTTKVTNNFTTGTTFTTTDLELAETANLTVSNTKTPATTKTLNGKEGSIIVLDTNFTPIKVTGTTADSISGTIKLKATEAIDENTVLFTTKYAGNGVFDVTEIKPETETELNYTVTSISGKAYMKPIVFEMNETGYALWTDVITAIETAKASDAAYTVKLLDSTNINGALKLPKSGTYGKLTITSESKTLTFTGSSVALTGELAVLNTNLDSAKNNASSKYTISAGKHTFTAENADLGLAGITGTGNVTLKDTKTSGTVRATKLELNGTDITGAVTVNGALTLNGENTILGTMTAYELGSTEDGTVLNILKNSKGVMSITKTGITENSKEITIRLIDSDGNAVEASNKTVIASSFKGSYNGELKLSTENGEFSIILFKNKLVLANSETAANGLLELDPDEDETAETDPAEEPNENPEDETPEDGDDTSEEVSEPDEGDTSDGGAPGDDASGEDSDGSDVNDGDGELSSDDLFDEMSA